MTNYISTKLADVEAYCAIVSKAEGYPKDGTPVGGGIHVPPELAVTLRHAEPTKHPDRDEWRAPVDAKAVSAQTSKVLTVAEKNALAIAVTSAKTPDSTWTPKIAMVISEEPIKEADDAKII